MNPLNSDEPTNTTTLESSIFSIIQRCVDGRANVLESAENIVKWHKEAITNAQIEALDKVYELAPKSQFKDWKPQDALQFFERLRQYESQLTAARKEKSNNG